MGKRTASTHPYRVSIGVPAGTRDLRKEQTGWRDIPRMTNVLIAQATFIHGVGTSCDRTNQVEMSSMNLLEITTTTRTNYSGL